MTTTIANRDRLIGMLFGFFPAQVLQTVAQLDVAEHLAGGPLPVAELAVRTGTDPDALYRLVRAASILGLVSLDGGSATLTPDGALLRRGEPGSVGRLAMLFCGSQTWSCWGDLAESVRTGDNAWERLTGRSTFAFFDGDPELSDTFTEAMAEGTRAAAPAIVDHTDLSGVGTLADLGGGNGTLLAAFLAANPGVRGILFDGAGAHGDAADVLGDLPAEIVAGDFFESVPVADAYVVKSVFHDWDDERSLAILASVRAAIPQGGALLVVEPVVPTDPEELAGRSTLLMSDLNMLVCTGGKERTHAEFDALLARGGFRLESVTPCPPSGYSVLRAVPAE
jgi:orsellinic acid C2-O-methyltransferase